jgi:hypothetical protein
MSKNSVSKSPERHTFQLEGAKERAAEDGTEVPEAYIEFWKTAKQQDEENLVDPEWQKDNLEYDLRSTDWILAKARTRDSYAQNIYAALCNMRWQKLDVFPILKEEYWSCSWRSAGGIVADMLQKGDYIDWYCSGMGGLATYNVEEGDAQMAEMKYVPEGHVTDEIRADFQKLGWVPSEWPDDET